MNECMPKQMEKILSGGPEDTKGEIYPGSVDDAGYTCEVWEQFGRFYRIRNQSLDILGGRNIQGFWDDSVEDYSAITFNQSDQNNPVVPYSSSISRDKANVFIAQMAARMYFPSVSAQNALQQTDNVLSRVSKPLLQWASDNDGFPDENGMLKNCRYIHKLVVEGTVHIQDDVDRDGLHSQLVPNEELYIGNFWQPSIEKQPLLIRAQLNVTWGEAEALFGDLDRFQYVQRNSGWLGLMYLQFPELKQIFDGIIYEDRASILWVWKKATHNQLKELKRLGKVKKSAKRACFFNVMVNNILMYPADNLSPYRDGYYPIKKAILEPMAKTEFYYGNSIPNKISEDKRWIDAWKTMMRFLAKQNALRPLQNLGGGDFDDTIYLPSHVTNVDDGIALQPIPGIGDGINQSHVQILSLTQAEIDRGSVSQLQAGQPEGGRMSATASSILEGNARQLMDNFTREVVFLQEARSVPLLMRLYQFLPRADIKQISIPEQTLRDGTRGNLEIIFKHLGKMTKDEELIQSMKMRMEEQGARKAKNPKDMTYIDPTYLENITFYVKSDASSAAMDQDGMRAQRFETLLPFLLQNPDIFDRKGVGRQLVQMNDLPDDLLTEESPNAPSGQPGQAPQQSGKPGQPQGQPGQPPQMNTPNQPQMRGVGGPGAASPPNPSNPLKVPQI